MAMAMAKTRKRQRSEQEDPEASSSSNEFEVSMLNGSPCKVRGLRVLDLKVQSQIQFQKGFLKLVANGRVLDLNGRCDEQLNPGDLVTAIAQQPKLVGTQDAFALFCVGGDTVVTWGNQKHGGKSSHVAGRLRNVVDIQSTDYAFAAILNTGTVVTWGDPDYGGCSIFAQHQLKNVKKISAGRFNFTAVRSRGRVVWGKLPAVSYAQHIAASYGNTYAVIVPNRRVVTWGIMHDMVAMQALFIINSRECWTLQLQNMLLQPCLKVDVWSLGGILLLEVRLALPMICSRVSNPFSPQIVLLPPCCKMDVSSHGGFPVVAGFFQGKSPMWSKYLWHLQAFTWTEQ